MKRPLTNPALEPAPAAETTDISRRRMIQRVGCLVAVATLPGSRLVGEPTGESAAESPVPAAPAGPSPIGELAAYMSAAAHRDVSPEAVEKAKHHILDTIAAMVSGAELAPAVVALKYARAHSGEPAATIVGSNLRCGPADAAFVNGMLAHSDETDDSHAPSHTHPGCSVVPAALAAGEYYRIGGATFVRAVVLGYDIGTRFSASLGGLKFQMKTHHSSHSIGGNFGAGAAAACAAGLDARQMRWVIDYAAQQACASAAWQRDTEHVSKSQVFAGRPARNGVTSALMIKLGATGVNDILTGPDNFFALMTPNANPAALLDKLGERYEVTRTNIKKWTVGSPIQAPLDALESLRKRRAFTADEVRKVVVRVATSEAKTVNNRNIPDICLQHMVAVMLLDGTASFAAAHDEARMKDPAILRERAKVELVPDEALEKLYPERVSIVEVTFADGTTLTERVGAVRGTAENPMTRDEVIGKSRDLMAVFLGGSQTDRLIDQVMQLETLKDIRELQPLLQRS